MAIQITGSWNLTGSYTASQGFFGTASYATYALSASYAPGGGGGTSGPSPSYTSASGILDLDGAKMVFASQYNSVGTIVTRLTGSQNVASILNNGFANITISGSLDFPVLTFMGTGCFGTNPGIFSINAPSMSFIPTNGFSATTNMVSCSMVNVKTINASAFQNSSCSFFDFGGFNSGSIIGSNVFNNSKIVNTNFISGAILISGSAQASGPFRGVTTLVSASFPSCSFLGPGAFAFSSLLANVNLRGLSGSNALGGSTAATDVFTSTALSGSITIPSFYSSSNAGAPDGDLAYLISRAWTVNYV